MIGPMTTIHKNTKKSTNSRSAVEKVETPVLKTMAVKLTRGELVHIRDLFGVLLPPAATKTLSQSLAERTNRPMVEACLWRKLERACTAMGVPLGDDAPDFAVSIGSVPELTVFQIEAEADDGSGQDGDLEAAIEAGIVVDAEAEKPAQKSSKPRKGRV